jgi:hypothetical protein
MPHIEFSVDTDVPPEKVTAAATDFTDRRPDIWPNISRRYWQVHELGEGFCECTEGSDIMGGIWARERYEWSANRIVGTVLDSNVFSSGTWTLTVEPLGTGSRVHVVNDREPKGKGRVSAFLMRFAGKRILTDSLRKTLDLIRDEKPPGTTAQPTG